MKTRVLPSKTVIANLKMLLKTTGWSCRELARRAKGKVSDRHIGKILAGDSIATVDVLDFIAEPFGLTAWNMIQPGLQLEMAKNGKLEKLMANYHGASDAVRKYIDEVAERASKPEMQQISSK